MLEKLVFVAKFDKMQFSSIIFFQYLLPSLFGIMSFDYPHHKYFHCHRESVVRTLYSHLFEEYYKVYAIGLFI